MPENKSNKMIYCHFSFKRPKGKNYGLFAVAFYWDFPGKRCIMHTTKKFDLWQNQQFITAIQSYENALSVLHDYQGLMKKHNITQAMLVTDNSTLAGWIMNPKKNKDYTAYMERAVKQYRIGGAKELVIGIGLCEPRDAEKSYKYCKEELVDNEYKTEEEKKAPKEGYKINIVEGQYKSILDIIQSDPSIPTIDGIKPV